MLHVYDLQVTPDCVCALLLELSDTVPNRQAALTKLHEHYDAWCRERSD